MCDFILIFLRRMFVLGWMKYLVFELCTHLGSLFYKIAVLSAVEVSTPIVCLVEFVTFALAVLSIFLMVVFEVPSSKNIVPFGMIEIDLSYFCRKMFMTRTES